MTVRQLLDKELDALPNDQQAEVLDYVRYLRLTRVDDATMDREFRAALKQTQRTGRRLGITDEDIAREIEEVRRGR